MEYETTYGTDAVDMGYRNASQRVTCEEIIAEMEAAAQSDLRVQLIAAAGLFCGILVMAASAWHGGL